jgi:hypothetical protein
MALEPWYKHARPRAEVREGRSFDPDDFAIALEQVVAETAPDDYRDPQQFFDRTCFTKALREHLGIVMRRLSGHTANTPPVMSLITQFGGGKTHTLTALYHLVRHRDKVTANEEIAAILKDAGLSEVPPAKWAVFVGNAWDAQEGRETPWIDVARQLAGDEGVRILGPAAKTTPPGTETLTRLFQAAGGRALILFDEVLNFINRYRQMAESFYYFIHNLTVSMTGTTHSAAVFSLPRSKVEMTDWDIEWQQRITRVVHRVARDLIANDESEISEVVRRRLFEGIGKESARKTIARAYADWCFERRAQLPPKWTAVDTATTEAKAREYLRQRFEACYPFHPATLSVFQEKWQTLPQYQQTRGTLAMLAQWISWAYRDGYQRARREALITLGSAPLEVREFRAVVLGQLDEPRLETAIETDIVGERSHASVLDADTKGVLKDIHRRVAKTILFESSGGMRDKVAHLPELRFALGEPQLDTTSIDNAASALEKRAYYVRPIGTDGYRFSVQATLKKAVSNKRASLDYDEDVKPECGKLARREFEKGAAASFCFFPKDSSDVPDNPKLTLVVLDPDVTWDEEGELRARLTEWTRQRGQHDRHYPAALIWCIPKAGSGLRDKVEQWLAWKGVKSDIETGALGSEYDTRELAGVDTHIREAEEVARDEVWADYRFVLVADAKEETGTRLIDLGAGHASGGESLCGRILSALKSEGLLNESVGVSYIERNWPKALQESGTWSLQGLRQSFLDGSLTRLPDPERVLRERLIDFIERGGFGLATDQRADGSYERVWFSETVDPEDIRFDAHTYLVKRNRAAALKSSPSINETDDSTATKTRTQKDTSTDKDEGTDRTESTEPAAAGAVSLRLHGDIPPEVWNKMGTSLIPKLKQGEKLQITLNASVEVAAPNVDHLERELQQTLGDLGLAGKVRIKRGSDGA